MKIITKYVEIQDNIQQTLEITKEKFDKSERSKIIYPCYLFLDQASSSGYCLYDDKGRLIKYGSLTRDSTNDTMIRFSNKLVDWVKEEIMEYDIEYIYFEETYTDDNVKTKEQLDFLKNKIKEIGEMNKDITLSTIGLAPSTWKNALYKGEKNPLTNKKRDAQKKAIEKTVSEYYPLLEFDNDDMTDSMGMACSVMLKGNKKEPWKMTRYRKNLPVHEMIIEYDLNSDNVNEKVAKMRKGFRDAYNVGGFVELELNTRKKIDDTVKRYLSHKDVLLAVKIPKTYKYWAYMLLMNNINPKDLTNEDQSFILVTARKTRI